MDIYLLGCTKDKEERKCKALDMYKKSKLFRVSLEYALSKVESKDKQIFILSAEYYLLALNDVIEPYDTSLNDFSKEEKKIWANKVHEIMKEKFDIENTNFIVLAGINYFEPLLLYLDKERIINPIPVEERTIGKRISWLKRNTGGELLLAKSFRDINVRSQVPKDKPGYYKWWASLDSLKVLLNSPFLSKNYLDDILPYLTVKKINNKDYYYIYVGIAVESHFDGRWHFKFYKSQEKITQDKDGRQHRGARHCAEQILSAVYSKYDFGRLYFQSRNFDVGICFETAGNYGLVETDCLLRDVQAA